MLYKKKEKKLKIELFQNPTAEYRAFPFWAWNSKLEQKELDWQLESFKKMGFGGVHMHVRTGMSTPYLGDEHMDIVKACVKKAKSEGMLACLYDEDRWPSGPAGGLVTREEQFRGRYLLFTPHPYGSKEAKIVKHNSGNVRSGRTENGRLLACYDIELDDSGNLVSSRIIKEDEEAIYEKWYAYIEIFNETDWWNGQTYVNTLDKAAMDRFIEITYERYNATVSDEFGKTIPSIFTDEPQLSWKGTLKYATDKKDVTLPWTDNLAVTYENAYAGEDLIGGIPELIWNRADGKYSIIRYHYHDHVCERFTEAFMDNCGKWCEQHSIALTGHVLKEDTLCSQTLAIGEAMRTYRRFGIPGMDILCSRFEYNTAKQAQSVVHQYGREAMLSEMYGVTNWDFDFRGYKLHGDWQAALGVTVRVPHLSLLSMEGEAKRDYPASINYQSPWWDKFSVVEDHFARVSTALTRGKPLVRVGMIHPIESYWLHWGPEETTALVRDNMDKNFRNLTEWLLFGGIDFDFISESLFPELCNEAKAPLQVGKMKYDIILVPGCETLRSTTLERLEGFVNDGGKVFFVGDIPTLENAVPSERARKLAEKSCITQYNRSAVLQAVEEVRLVELRDQTGALTTNLLHQVRQDGDGCWLFIAHGKEPYNKHISNYQDLRIRVKGTWKATIYDTTDGTTKTIEQRVQGNYTELRSRLYDYDSLLIWLEWNNSSEVAELVCDATTVEKEIAIPRTVPYTLTEPNVLLLDCAEYALDDGEWQAEEEILRIDIACRKALGWPTDIANVSQPWTLKEEAEKHWVRLRWNIHSDIEYSGAKLAIERNEMVTIKWNGSEIPNIACGWFADKAIKTIALPNIKKGVNVLEAVVPISSRITVEWAYILGDFGVEVCGRNTGITEKRKELAFGSITTQGLPFYSGNIIYHIPVELKKGRISVCSNQYVGALQEVSIDDGKSVPCIYPPYVADLGEVHEGKHMIHMKFYGNRVNSFGALHMADTKKKHVSPNSWRTSGDQWCYEYKLRELGVLTSPKLIQYVED